MSQSMMSVSSLNTKIKSLLEATFIHTLVEGEVASVTYHTSGHLYFSIKDDKSSIKCVMWRSSVVRMKFLIEKGMHIVVEGSVSVYTPRGEYQFQTVKIEPYGKGALALAFEQLKEKLKSQGYFDAHCKKTIPKNIQKIVLVTAQESAALYDMLKIIEKRWALVEVVIVDTLVQGEKAAKQIANSLKYADTLEADVVIVGRGGGSVEDLWAFNTEIVANSIFAMQTPVVSAVGHEIDVLISDYVADLRAPTPSAAIEMILPDHMELLYTLEDTLERFQHLIIQKINNAIETLKHSEALLLGTSPYTRLKENQIECKRLMDEYKRVIDAKIEYKQLQLPSLYTNLQQSLFFILQQKKDSVAYLSKMMHISNPKGKIKTGWVEISTKGQKIELEHIKINDEFYVTNTKVKVKVKALKKEKIGG